MKNIKNKILAILRWSNFFTKQNVLMWFLHDTCMVWTREIKSANVSKLPIEYYKYTKITPHNPLFSVFGILLKNGRII
jgi:hypothetical protein